MNKSYVEEINKISRELLYFREDINDMLFDINHGDQAKKSVTLIENLFSASESIQDAVKCLRKAIKQEDK